MPRRAGGHPGHPGWGARPTRRVTSPLLQKGCLTPRRCTTLSQEGYASPQERRPASQEGCPVLLPPRTGTPAPAGFPPPHGWEPLPRRVPQPWRGTPPQVYPRPSRRGTPLSQEGYSRCTEGVPHLPGGGRRGAPASKEGAPPHPLGGAPSPPGSPRKGTHALKEGCPTLPRGGPHGGYAYRRGVRGGRKKAV